MGFWATVIKQMIANKLIGNKGKQEEEEETTIIGKKQNKKKRKKTSIEIFKEAAINKVFR